MTQAEIDILAEREKQRTDPRYGDKHDDEHADGALAAVASLLAYPTGFDADCDPMNGVCIPAPSWGSVALAKHSNDRRKQLVIATALLIAEIERIDRANA